VATAELFFPYDVDKRWALLFKALGLTPDDGVKITEDGRLIATYGRLGLDTSVANVDHTEISGPHRPWTAVGARLSFADDGLTFGTNHRQGLCIAFTERVPKVLGFRHHSALWVSVADCAGLAASLAQR
jgi:hypothetical protein